MGNSSSSSLPSSSSEVVAAVPDTTKGSGRMTVSGYRNVLINEICGCSPNGVPAYSNHLSTIKSSTPHYLDGLFMGVRWQCVEYARRWLWLTKGLLLPTRVSAFRYAGLSYVYLPKEDGTAIRPTPICSVPDPRKAETTDEESAKRKRLKNQIQLEKVPCVFVKQGTSQPPTPDSLIIYPFTWGNMTGHIGVITYVDLDAGLVGVTDQNRFFTQWEEKGSEGTTAATPVTHSATFALECVQGKFYIRDDEVECAGWITFPGISDLPQGGESNAATPSPSSS